CREPIMQPTGHGDGIIAAVIDENLTSPCRYAGAALDFFGMAADKRRNIEHQPRERFCWLRLVPTHEVCCLNTPKTDREPDILNSNRNEDTSLFGIVRFFVHPIRLD